MMSFVLSTNDIRSERSESECLLCNNNAVTSSFYMYSVVNQFSNSIQDNKNTFVRLVLSYCFILHIISTILTEKLPGRHHVCLLSYVTILYPSKCRAERSVGLLCKSSEHNGRLCYNSPFLS